MPGARPNACLDCGEPITKRSTYCVSCVKQRQSDAARKRLADGALGVQSPALEFCPIRLCGLPLRAHRRCAACTILVGPDHLESELVRFQGLRVCGGCQRYLSRHDSATVDWSAA